MGEKYKLIKHNENLAEIGNNGGLGLLFLVDEDCERKLRIIVDLLNEQEVEIDELNQENKQLRKQVESSETTSNATSHYNAFLESKISTLEEENRELRHELDSLSGCYCADNKEFKDYWRIGYDE